LTRNCAALEFTPKREPTTSRTDEPMMEGLSAEHAGVELSPLAIGSAHPGIETATAAILRGVAIKAAVLAERERCAKIAAAAVDHVLRNSELGFSITLEDMVERIRSGE
jgi:hypothetical protein